MLLSDRMKLFPEKLTLSQMSSKAFHELRRQFQQCPNH
jgi:hypothetical protein